MQLLVLHIFGNYSGNWRFDTADQMLQLTSFSIVTPSNAVITKSFFLRILYLRRFSFISADTILSTFLIGSTLEGRTVKFMSFQLTGRRLLVLAL